VSLGFSWTIRLYCLVDRSRLSLTALRGRAVPAV